MRALWMTFAMLMLLATAQARLRFPTHLAQQYAGLIHAMTVCQEGLIQYTEANAGTAGPIASAELQSYLPSDTPVSTCAAFTFLVTAPGTATSYLTVPIAAQDSVATELSRLQLNAIVVGPVSGGTIYPQAPQNPTAAAAGVPDGVIAIQTVVRNH